MPVYQFQCREHPDMQVEDFWAINEEITVFPYCPVCSKVMRRMFPVPAIHLKGGGWGSKAT